jgi:phosphoenolpyruvate carboxykinase (ATP)
MTTMARPSRTPSSDELVRDQLAEMDLYPASIQRNLPAPELIARSLARGEGILAANGAIVVRTGSRTGRSPADRFFVDEPGVHEGVCWGDVNVPCRPETFDRLLEKASGFLRLRDAFVFDGYAGADPAYRTPVRIVTAAAWHALFARTLFLSPTSEEAHEPFVPQLTVVDCGALTVSPETDGSRSEAFIGIDLTRRLVLIVGTMYGGEIKKSVFTVLNYLLPEMGVLPMHCAANMGRQGDVALFFGLSGTGKTTLSADPHRRLIGDDEHGWSDGGVFNMEGGCYAKVIRLSPRAEPQIYKAIRFGSILENVGIDPLTRAIDYHDATVTENTRATYPVEHIRSRVASGVGGHPRHVVFLTCDAFGVLPPIARLSPEMAGYHFLSGFTSRVAGTEAGVVEPVPTFSTCFGAPFMPRDPITYQRMLAERVRRHGTACWLVNTGWTGGPYGTGHRIDIGVTRALLTAALSGALDATAFDRDRVFGVLVPDAVPGVSSRLLHPRDAWSDGAAYDRQAERLVRMFAENFRHYESSAPELAAAGPGGGVAM